MINDSNYKSQHNAEEYLKNLTGTIVDIRGIRSLGQMTFNEKRCFCEAANDLDYYKSMGKNERRQWIDDTIKSEHDRQYKSTNDPEIEEKISNIYFYNQGDKDEI